MEELTKEQAHDLCVESWNEIAENGYTSKIQSKIIRKYRPDCECFACEYYSNTNCSYDNVYCPFKSPGNKYKNTPCESAMRSYYRAWNKKKSKENAIAIADLFID